MGPSPILSVIHAVTIGTMLNLNSGKNGHGLKMLRVHRCKIVVISTNGYAISVFYLHNDLREPFKIILFPLKIFQISLGMILNFNQEIEMKFNE